MNSRDCVNLISIENKYTTELLSLFIDTKIMNNPPPKVLLVASAGGHWVQLKRLVPAFSNCNLTYVTTDKKYQENAEGDQIHIVPDANRWNKLKVLWLAFMMLYKILLIRPNVVVSTGAAPGFFALFWAKRIGAKTIWIDSIANVETLSMSGQKVAKYADLWLTQWEHLARSEGPSYIGAVL